jgi:hypothetical protein
MAKECIYIEDSAELANFIAFLIIEIGEVESVNIASCQTDYAISLLPRGVSKVFFWADS